MQFIDLQKQYQRIKTEIDNGIQAVINHGRFILGPEVHKLEQHLAQYVGVKHCITVANGSDALLVALMSLNIGPGDEVITTPFTFLATVEMICLLGAKPVFVDIDPQTYNINAQQIEKVITKSTKVIMPVSLYGQCADMETINQIAAKHHLPVIEDAAQSFGATFKDKKSCALSTIACTSFYPAKPLACYGDGGACFTNDDELAEKIRKIRNHGQEKTYYHVMMGVNSRLDSIQAAVLLEKLKIFAEELELRQQVAQEYDKLLQEGSVITPFIATDRTSAYAQYTIRVGQRDQLRAYLQEFNIPTAVHYPRVVFQQPVFAHLSVAGEFTEAEKAAKQVLSLPMHPYLESKDIEFIAEKIKTFVQEQNLQQCVV